MSKPPKDPERKKEWLAKRREYHKKWNAKHPSGDYLKDWRAKHPGYSKKRYDNQEYAEQCRQSAARRRAANPEYQKEYRKINKEYFHAFDRNRAKQCAVIRDCIKLFYGCQNPTCQTMGDLPACCLDFHHVDRSTKEFGVTRWNGCKIKLFAEIRKCTVLCSNCHRQATYHKKCNLDASGFHTCQVDDEGNCTEPEIWGQPFSEFAREQKKCIDATR